MLMLHYCPVREGIQLDLPKAALEEVAAREFLVATVPDTPIEKKILADHLTAAKHRVDTLTHLLVNHVDDCSACAKLRKAA